MMNTAHQLAAELKSLLGNFVPQTALILGSGLGTIADAVENPLIIEYADIKGFPQSTVSGHRGRLVCGRIGQQNVLCMQGRFHLYEGYAATLIADIIHAYKLIGVQNLIVTNAAGSLRRELEPGALMLIADHINFSGRNPLVGPNDDSLGPRFPDMSNAYDQELRLKAHQIARQEMIPLADGVYLWVLGPNFETAAEIRAFQALGADAVGMSTVPEVIAAVHAGMRVLGFSVITNYGTGLQTQPQTHAETLAKADAAAQNLQKLIFALLKEMNE